jgi:alkylation response protein AidB-like acyl-CoA dehydrogenase
MNDIALPSNPSFPVPVALRSSGLRALLDLIAEGASERVAVIHRQPRSHYHARAERPPDDPILQQAVGQIASNAFAAEASLRAAKAKVLLDELAIRVASLLLDIGGASATKRSTNLDRHWRNARTLASHDPGTYNARAIGDHVINGAPLMTVGFL